MKCIHCETEFDLDEAPDLYDELAHQTNPNYKKQYEYQKKIQDQLNRFDSVEEIIDLLQFGEDHINSGYTLLVEIGNPKGFDSARVLIHLGIEQVLKAYLLHIDGKFDYIHELKSLAEKLDLDDRSAKILQKVQVMFDRYPVRNVVPEIGTDDWEDIEYLVRSIFDQFPQSLLDIYDQIIPTQKRGRVLMRQRQFCISDAAKYLGVTTQTLRNWDKSERLVPKRLNNGYRVYPEGLLKKYKNDLKV